MARTPQCSSKAEKSPGLHPIRPAHNFALNRVARDVLADGILAGPVALGHRLIHYRHKAAVFVVQSPIERVVNKKTRVAR